jgi:hypothetical protein
VSDNGQLAGRPESARGQICPVSRGGRRLRRAGKRTISAEFRHFFRLARVLLRNGQQGVQKGVQIMSVSKFETFCFMAGFIATGFLSLVALPLAA